MATKKKGRNKERCKVYASGNVKLKNKILKLQRHIARTIKHALHREKRNEQGKTKNVNGVPMPHIIKEDKVAIAKLKALTNV